MSSLLGSVPRRPKMASTSSSNNVVVTFSMVRKMAGVEALRTCMAPGTIGSMTSSTLVLPEPGSGDSRAMRGELSKASMPWA